MDEPAQPVGEAEPRWGDAPRRRHGGGGGAKLTRFREGARRIRNRLRHQRARRKAGVSGEYRREGDAGGPGAVALVGECPHRPHAGPWQLAAAVSSKGGLAL